MAILSLPGKIPVHNDWLIIMLNGRDTTFSISFSNFVEILSHSALDLGLRFRMIFSMSSGFVLAKLNDAGQGVVR